jgi:ABC-type transporter Mla subunit MlaD
MKASRRNNLVAGTFLLASIVLAIVVSIVLADAGERFIPKNTYVVRFTLADGASGLLPGSPVQIGGRQVGRVTDVRFAHANPAEPDLPTAVDVYIRVPRSITIFENAVVTLNMPLIGAMGSVNIIDLGSPAGVAQPSGRSAQLEDSEILAGSIAPPSFLAQAGIGPDQTRMVREIIEHVDEIVRRFDQMSLRLESSLDTALANITSVSDDARVVVADIRAREPEWADQIDETLARITTAAENADLAIQDFRAGVSQASSFIDDAQATLDDNRPKVDRTLDNIEAASATVNSESVATLNRSLEKLENGVAEFSELGKNANAALAERTPELRATMANLRLASDQLKLALVEIRRNPWRVLYRPNAKETRTEILYDAARAYAASVSDLRAASEALQAASAGAEPDSEQISMLISELHAAFSRFEETERALLDKLIEE